ncbi:hypothetical protein GF345_04070 [Candidatus Woesearchaeota archaeon]|nr:hypothetical protein [Candidatus Woesearchaeota archaeon]
MILIAGCASDPAEPSGQGADDTQTEDDQSAAVQDTESGNEAEIPSSDSDKISLEELSQHSTEDDCWIVYEGMVYDFTGASMHPNMAKTFYSHCGHPSSFEEAAKARHSGSSEERVSLYGDLLGELEQT